MNFFAKGDMSDKGARLVADRSFYDVDHNDPACLRIHVTFPSDCFQIFFLFTSSFFFGLGIFLLF